MKEILRSAPMKVLLPAQDVAPAPTRNLKPET